MASVRPGRLGFCDDGDQPIDQLGNSILAFLGIPWRIAGALFVGGAGLYRRAATYGVPDDVPIAAEFKSREGLLGQAAAEGRPMMVGEVPDGYLAFGSALGRGKPRHLAILPGSIDGAVNSVIELGFLRPVDESVIALLKHASASVGIAVRSANYRSRAQSLLEETQRQAEELQTQSEELRVSNEELEEQSRALKEFKRGSSSSRPSWNRRIRSLRSRPSSWNRSVTTWSGPTLPST